MIILINILLLFGQNNLTLKNKFVFMRGKLGEDMTKSHKRYIDHSSAKLLCSLCKDAAQTSEKIARNIYIGPSTVKSKIRYLLLASRFVRGTASFVSSIFSNVTITLVGITLNFRKLSKIIEKHIFL